MVHCKNSQNCLVCVLGQISVLNTFLFLQCYLTIHPMAVFHNAPGDHVSMVTHTVSMEM